MAATATAPAAMAVLPEAALAEEQAADSSVLGSKELPLATAPPFSPQITPQEGLQLRQMRQPVHMFKAIHLFVELHEFKDDHWLETHRWNHGLEEDLVPKKGYGHSKSQHLRWTRPHLPSISLFGMMALREALSEDLVVLDIEDDMMTLEPIADAMLDGLIASRRIQPEERPLARAGFMKRLMKKESAVVARPRKQFRSGEQRPARTVSEDSGIESDDPLKMDPEEEIAHILIDSVEWLKSDIVGIARLIEPIDTGLEEQLERVQSPHTRFMVMIFGPRTAGHENRHAEMGEAFAALLQEDALVNIFYQSTTPAEIVSGVQERFLKLRLMPHTTRPTHEGIKKRAKSMLKQMAHVRELGDDENDSQVSRWMLRQQNPFTNGFSVRGVIDTMQQFALPLVCGITLALVAANLDARCYDHWAGYGHGQEAAPHRALGGAATGDNGCDTGDRPDVLGLAVHGHSVTLHFVVNDILMCLFFGLAMKEICEAFQPGGSLYPPTRTTVNVLAATVGGVVGPILVYIGSLGVLSLSGALDDHFSFANYANGWGIPTATDISVAWVAALCVFGAGHPAINYLLLLAIVDDGIGLMIIAFAYPDAANPVEPVYLLLVVAGMFVAFTLRRLRCARWQPYVVLAGPLAWCGLLWTRLHPSLALVFVVPFMPLRVEDESLHIKWIFSDHGHRPVHHHEKHDHSKSPLHNFEEATKTFVDFIVLFSFGAVNAGVQVDSVGALTVAVVLALWVGKPLGIFVSAIIAGAFGCPPPTGMGKGSVIGVGVIASAGLTVSLFISGEAYKEHPLLASQAKMGALLSVILAILLVVASLVRSHFLMNKASEGDEDQLDISENQGGDDEDLEAVIVESAVKSLHVIHLAEKAVEERSGLSRAQTIEELNKKGGRSPGSRRSSRHSLSSTTPSAYSAYSAHSADDNVVEGERCASV